MQNSKVKIALIQIKCVNDNDENLKNAAAKVKEAASLGADLVVLPEMFSCPYKASNFPIYAQAQGGKNWQLLSQCAAENKVYLVAGSIPEVEDGKIFNTSFVFDPQGKQIARHRKVHLFDCDIPGGAFFHESDTLTAGDDITVFDTKFGKVGLMICFDIRFPELARLMMEKGASLFIVPAAFNMTSGPNWWEIMFRVRATDNQVFMAGCAPARDEKASYVAWGHSIFVDPFGKVLAQMDEKEGILVQELDLASVGEFRSQYKILKSRRLDLYELKEK